MRGEIRSPRVVAAPAESPDDRPSEPDVETQRSGMSPAGTRVSPSWECRALPEPPWPAI